MAWRLGLHGKMRSMRIESFLIVVSKVNVTPMVNPGTSATLVLIV